jgi:hypothetical protein
VARRAPGRASQGRARALTPGQRRRRRRLDLVRPNSAIEVPPRSVQFVEFGDGVTLASLVCEDLAQTDDVAHVIRSVGPMIVVTPLLDGPSSASGGPPGTPASWPTIPAQPC